jgi:hypothetical protein
LKFISVCGLLCKSSYFIINLALKYLIALFAIAKLAVQLKTIDESLDLLNLLTRDSNKEKYQNKLTFLEEFIKSTGRFPALASPVPRHFQPLVSDHIVVSLNGPSILPFYFS